MRQLINVFAVDEQFEDFINNNNGLDMDFRAAASIPSDRATQ